MKRQPVAIRAKANARAQTHTRGQPLPTWPSVDREPHTAGRHKKVIVGAQEAQVVVGAMV